MKSPLAAFLIVALLLLTPVPTHAAAPDDYVSCWDFEETSGTRLDANRTNSNDLTDNNTVGSATGIIGNAADFEAGASEYLSITDADQVGLEPTAAMSLAVWIKIESQQNAPVIAKDFTGAGDYAYRIGFGGDPLPEPLFTNYVISGTKRTVLSTAEMNTGAWHYLVSTYDGTTIRTYLNGTADNTGAFSGTISTSTYPVLFGKHEHVAVYYDGLMDIAEIYDRALDPAEVTALYNGGAGVACTDRGEAEVTTTPHSFYSGGTQLSGEGIIQ